MKQVGLIGYPVAHSFSPAMQQAAFDACGIEARYVLWETPPKAMEQRIASLRAPNMLGANVTVPHKECAFALVGECDALAARIGAVNTIVNRHGRLIGYNTDAPGLLRALREQGFEPRGKRVVMLGTGGAARGGSVALLESGVEELTLLGRTQDRLHALLHHLRALAAAWFSRTSVNGALLGSDEASQALARAELLMNATPVGLKANKANDTTLLVDVSVLPASALVMDMIFNPPRTPLLQAAQERGLLTLNGLSMLLYQGAAAFELWTGQPAPVEVMREALQRALPLV
ncbi:MAG TPA: shikimate dehydrogenase [Ktedonobacteraceae bacterium]|nr:shikimate dehydrogenase [Ktedonobacteraceae bacterium]